MMASASLPVGAPPPLGFMDSQKNVWFQTCKGPHQSINLRAAPSAAAEQHQHSNKRAAGSSDAWMPAAVKASPDYGHQPCDGADAAIQSQWPVAHNKDLVNLMMHLMQLAPASNQALAAAHTCPALLNSGVGLPLA